MITVVIKIAYTKDTNENVTVFYFTTVEPACQQSRCGGRKMFVRPDSTKNVGGGRFLGWGSVIASPRARASRLLGPKLIEEQSGLSVKR